MLHKLILLFFTASLTVGIAAENPNRQHRVILITIDGGAAFYFDDPKAPLTNLRRIAAEGVVARGMKVSNPAVTWPNHTTLVTGVSPAKHFLLYNGLMVPNKKGGLTRESERSKSELIAVPTVYDFLHAKGFSTAAVNWPATQKAATLDFVLPDLHTPLPFTTPQLIKELTAEKILNESSVEAFLNVATPKREEIWRDIACYLLRTHKPNLMLLHFLIADGMQHRFGPQSPEAYEALGLIDQHIGKLFDTLEKSGLRESTTVLIGADHGFARFDKQVVATAVLHKAGLLETADGKTRIQIIPEGGTAMVYFRSKKTKDEDRKKVVELFKNHEGVDEIIEPKDFVKLGYPSPKKNPQMADLVLSAKDGYSFSSLEMVNQEVVPARAGGAGSHGYLSTNPKMNAMFIAMGRGIAKGKQIGVIENIDVAPTIAYLLGEKLPNVDGKVLKQILATP
jgi:predicted AlkP superfamily pyrophosphatase or phosphodiesterase